MRNIIAAIDEAGGIGKGNTIPWNHPSSVNYFRNLTSNSTVVMGRRTFDLYKATPLGGRRNVIICSNPRAAFEAYYSGDLSHQRSLATFTSDPFDPIITDPDLHFNDVWYIGGARLYANVIRHVDAVYITRIPGQHNCDKFFPALPVNFCLQAQTSSAGLTYEIYRPREHSTY